MADVEDERSGDDADVEDPADSVPDGTHDGHDEPGDDAAHDGEPYFDREEFIKKLREKPEMPPELENPPDEGCGGRDQGDQGKSGGGGGGGKHSAADRLSVRTLTKLDKLKQKIPFPKGAVPPLALPSWHFLPMERKIPLVPAPAGLLYYSRGKLATSLLRTRKVYSVQDPHNFERVVGGPYCALHDPHTKEYLFNPLTLRILRDQSLINDQSEVLCSLREFNKFRDYLRTLYTDEIWKQLESSSNFMKCQEEQMREIIKEQRDSVGTQAQKNERIAKARKSAADLQEFKRKKAEHKEHVSETRLKQWQLEKERKILEHVIKGIEDSKRNQERIQNLYEMRLQRRRDILTRSTRKFLETEERQKNDKAMMEAAYDKFLLEWIESKYVYGYEKTISQKQVQQDVAEEKKAKAKKRQAKLEKYREQLPMMVEKRKADNERIWGLVRKFAMRWLEKVRARKNAPKDDKHESCWLGGPKNVLDDTLKYLYQESGYEKLDDFILNIMKLKKQIQAQIELEEAEEAALLAAQEGGGGGGMSTTEDVMISRTEFESDSDGA